MEHFRIFCKIYNVNHFNFITPIILAAGFGRRTRGILNNIPKALIKTLGGKTILDHLIEDLTVNCRLKNIYIVTNGKYYQQITHHIKQYSEVKIQVINDGINIPEERMGALKDLLFAYKKIPYTSETYLVLPSDYAYWQAFSLRDFINFSKKNSNYFCIVAYDVKKKNIIKNRLSCMIIDQSFQVKKFIEKPENPPNTLAGSPFYIYRNRHMKLLENFINEGNLGDSPGLFIPYLLKKKEKVKAVIVQNNLIDAGTPSDIKKVKKY